MSDTQEYDVVVIGSGAGGGSVAWGLASKGVRVLVLEAGPFYDYRTDYRLDKSDWELRWFPTVGRERESYTFGPTQKLDEKNRDLMSWDKVRGRHVHAANRRAATYSHVQGVGGSTLHFLGEAHRLNPKSMKLKTEYSVAADWPLRFADLEPYYEAAERIVGVAGPAQSSHHPRRQPLPLRAHGLSYASRQVRKGCEKLGLTLEENSLAILSDAYDGRPPCNYCGNCIRGCPRADKGSVDATFLVAAAGTRKATIKANHQAVLLEAGPNDKVVSVVYADNGSALKRVKAKNYVVACGAVHTPRLLLASANAHCPDGLANDSGHVGRNFMETVYWTASGFHPEPLGSHRGPPADGVCWDFSSPQSIPGTVGGCVLTSGAPQSGLIGPVNYAQRVVPGWGKGHTSSMRRAFGRILTVTAIGECLPNPRSFVDLDPEMKDRAGLPVARIHSYLKAGEIRRLHFMAQQSRRILEASGVSELAEEYGSYDTFNSTHVFGTCRMGTDPQQSVVDTFCRSHRWRNLFTVDSSVFPSSGGGESPSLTIEALGLRTADYIVKTLR